MKRIKSLDRATALKLVEECQEAHNCAAYDYSPCVFCAMNEAFESHGLYAIPFDVPGFYSRDQEPNVRIVKYAKCHVPDCTFNICRSNGS